LLIDSVSDMRSKPVTVHATAATLEIIAGTSSTGPSGRISAPYRAASRRSCSTGQSLWDSRFGWVSDDHGASCRTHGASRWLSARLGAASLVFTGDTTVNAAFWPVINRIANLRYLLIETAFPNSERRLAEISKHLCPSLLAE
jgi:ribonuclease BN (tRNA processing enzyme)